MPKYHINPKTGKANKCSATVRGCRFVNDDGSLPQHYDSIEEAYKEINKDKSPELNKKKKFDTNISPSWANNVSMDNEFNKADNYGVDNVEVYENDGNVIIKQGDHLSYLEQASKDDVRGAAERFKHNSFREIEYSSNNFIPMDQDFSEIDNDNLDYLQNIVEMGEKKSVLNKVLRDNKFDPRIFSSSREILDAISERRGVIKSGVDSGFLPF